LIKNGGGTISVTPGGTTLPGVTVVKKMLNSIAKNY